MNDNDTESVLYVVGTRGYSAYEVAVQNGFVGTEQEWLESLVGPEGPQGQPFDDLTPEQKAEITGPQGKSAYDIAVEQGFEGTEEDFVNSYLNSSNYYNKQQTYSKEDINSKELGLQNTIDNEITNRVSTDNALQTQISSLANGTPLPAESIDDMTDTTKMYVNITDGYLYYYDGTEWKQGGLYQTPVDSNSVNALEEDVSNIVFKGYIDINSQIESWEIGSFNFETGAAENNPKRIRTSNFLKLNVGQKIKFSIENGYYYNVLYYNTPSDSGYAGNSQRINWTQDTLDVDLTYPYAKILVADNPVSQQATDANVSWGGYFKSEYASVITEDKDKIEFLNSIIEIDSDNILDPSTFTYNTSNTVISDYMRVDGGNAYGFLIYPGYWQLNTYDRNKTLLNTITVGASSYTANQIQTFDNNVAYIKLVVLTANKDYSMCIKKGNIVPSYTPYVGDYYGFTNTKYGSKYDFSSYGLAYIEDNKLKANIWNNDPQTAVYSGVDSGSDCYKMTCKAYWSSDDDNSTAAIIATKLGNKKSTDILTKALHPVFTRTGVRVDFFDNSVKTSIYSEDYETPLVSGVEYTFGWEITSPNTIVITSATGSHTITMEGYDFREYIGKYCILEHYNGNGTNQKGMVSFTEWKAYDENDKVIVFDLYTKPDGVLSTTLNGLVYYQFSTHAGWRVTN